MGQVQRRGDRVALILWHPWLLRRRGGGWVVKQVVRGDDQSGVRVEELSGVVAVQGPLPANRQEVVSRPCLFVAA